MLCPAVQPEGNWRQELTFVVRPEISSALLVMEFVLAWAIKPLLLTFISVFKLFLLKSAALMMLF